MALIALLAVVFILVMLNLGELTNSRLRAQSAVDVATLAGGEWMARGMNVISTLNILLTLLMTQLGIMHAFTATVHQAIVFASIGVATNCPHHWPLCEPYRREFSELSEISGRIDELQPEQRLLDSMRQIHELEVGIGSGQGRTVDLSSIAGLAAADVEYLGALFQVEQGGFYSVGASLATPLRLPLKSGVRADLCEPAKHGRLGGYDGSEGSNLIDATAGMSMSQTLKQVQAKAAEFNRGDNGPFYNVLLWMPYFEILLEKAPLSTFGGMLLAENIEPAWEDVCSSHEEETGPLLLTGDPADQGRYVGYLRYGGKTAQGQWWPERLENTAGQAQGMNVIAQAELYNPFSPQDTGIGGDTFTPQWRTHLVPIDPLAPKTVEALSATIPGVGAAQLGGGALFDLH